MSKVLCFGELLLRLSPQLNGAWIANNEMPVFIGGAELNVATALARWKQPVSYCTILPDHYLSKEVQRYVSALHIDTDRILFAGNRIGTYYLPQGADLKNAGVIYDRAHSSFWDLIPGQIDWDQVLDGMDWFHFSAISPALNGQVAAVCEEGLKAASAKGITISVDLNYRAKLWQYGKQPDEVMPSLAKYCNVVMGNIWAEEKMLGVKIDPDLPAEKVSFLDASREASQAIRKRFKNCRQVANTFRFDEGEGIRYYATLLDDDGFYVAPERTSAHIVDKVGSGDCFMAGLIYSNLQQWQGQAVIDFASAAAFKKLFIKGDSTTATVEEIKTQLSHVQT